MDVMNTGYNYNFKMWLTLLLSLGYFVSQGTATVCSTGYGYPLECPRSTDPSSYTKCCRDVQTPSCCSEESSMVCGAKTTSVNAISKPGITSGVDIDLTVDWNTKFCPEEGQPDDHTDCCFADSNVSCCKKQDDIDIGVVVLVIILLIIMTGILIFFILIQTKVLHIVDKGRCRYSILSKSQYEAYKGAKMEQRREREIEDYKLYPIRGSSAPETLNPSQLQQHPHNSTVGIANGGFQDSYRIPENGYQPHQTYPSNYRRQQEPPVEYHPALDEGFSKTAYAVNM